VSLGDATFEGGAIMHRFGLAAGLVASLTVAFAAVAQTASKPVELLVGFSDNSLTYHMGDILTHAWGQVLRRPVAMRSLAGDHGFGGALAVHAAAPDGNTLLLADNLTLALNEVAGGRPFSIDELTPLAKVTDGISAALVARQQFAIQNFDALVAHAKEAMPSLSVSGRQTAYGVAWSMLERVGEIEFRQVPAVGNGQILADVAEGRSEFGIVTTSTIPGFNATSEIKLQPLLTFGAKRSTLFPDTPTLAELSDDEHNDFTYSFSIFGPPGLPDHLIAQLMESLHIAIDAPGVKAQSQAIGFRLVYHDAQVVRETLARDQRTVRSVGAVSDK
jgi:tripartite-type tricarboxylate transporter receptor subunit TctC